MNSTLYGHLNPQSKTLFVRLTGDNFRASGKNPTEQISYSLLNNKDMIHSPYAQYISSLWRGSESRINVEIHTAEHYSEIKSLLASGLTVTFEENCEHFNILPIMCTDLCFVKEVIGKCSCTSLYGCFYCEKPIGEWDQDPRKETLQTMSKICSDGQEAIKVLGANPKHDTAEFTKFQQSHFGQYVSRFQ